MDFRFRDYLALPVHLLALHRWMKETPSWDAERMNQWTLDRLRALTVTAFEKVPYYRALFARIGFDPKSLGDFEHWRQVPILDKDTVRSNYDALRADDAKALGAVPCQTSGSTGTAMRFLLDRQVNMASFAIFWRAWSECPDWRIGKRQASLSGYAKGKWDYQWKTRVLALSSFHLGKENCRFFLDLIRRYRPAFLRGYPSSLYIFARLLEEAGLSLGFSVMFSGAESLLPFQRETIERVFGCRLVDHYSHWERCGSICQCEQGRYHALSDYGFHEIVNSDGVPTKPGEVGRLVLTSLHNHAMPLFRYDTRDLAAWSEETTCPCGSRFPIVQRIVGRIEDVVLTPEGNLVGRLDAAFKYSPHIRLAQIVQETVDRIEVYLVRDVGYNEEGDEVPLLRELRARLGQTIKIDLHSVEDIPRTPMGKLRFVVSRVDPVLKLGHS